MDDCMEQIMMMSNGYQAIGLILMVACFIRIIMTIMTPLNPRPARTYGATIYTDYE